MWWPLPTRADQRREEGERHVGARRRGAEEEPQSAGRAALERVHAQKPQKLGARVLEADEGVEARAAERGEADREGELGAKLGQKVRQHLVRGGGGRERATQPARTHPCTHAPTRGRRRRKKSETPGARYRVKHVFFFK